MYTTDMDPVDQRSVTSAFLVWASGDDLGDTLKKVEESAKKHGATAIVALRISATDGTYYVPAESFIGEGTTQRDMRSPGYEVQHPSWTAYGTAVKRVGDPDPPPPEVDFAWDPSKLLTEEALAGLRLRYGMK